MELSSLCEILLDNVVGLFGRGIARMMLASPCHEFAQCCIESGFMCIHARRVATPNDPKLSDRDPRARV